MIISLRPNLRGPLYRQLFETLRLAILDGSLGPGRPLPASRELARQLALSRNTVNAAYDMLRAEGYVNARQGSGYFIAADLPHWPDAVPAAAEATAPVRDAGFSSRGQILASPSRPVSPIANPAFQPGMADLALFPRRQWQQCLQQAAGLGPAVTAYQDQGGHPDFRQAVSDYLRLSRSVNCRPDQVIAINGSQAGLDLLTRMLIEPGDRVAVEEPGYLGARDAFRAAGAHLQPVPLDEEGLKVDVLAAQPTARLVYTTPSYQFPLGRTLSAARRLQLLNWATEMGSFVVEDDYDSEFRYGSRPLSSMQGLDQQQRVIYLGTFSKVMFPGLRLGYLVLPPAMARGFALALRKTGQDPPLFLQAAMAEFIQRGWFASHLRRMRKAYGEKQARLVDLLRQRLDGWLEVQPTEAGMQLACPYQQTLNQDRLLALAAERGLNLAALSRYYLGEPSVQGLYLGYAGVPLDELERNVDILAECFGALA